MHMHILLNPQTANMGNIISTTPEAHTKQRTQSKSKPQNQVIEKHRNGDDDGDDDSGSDCDCDAGRDSKSKAEGKSRNRSCAQSSNKVGSTSGKGKGREDGDGDVDGDTGKAKTQTSHDKCSASSATKSTQLPIQLQSKSSILLKRYNPETLSMLYDKTHAPKACNPDGSPSNPPTINILPCVDPNKPTKRKSKGKGKSKDNSTGNGKGKGKGKEKCEQPSAAIIGTMIPVECQPGPEKIHSLSSSCHRSPDYRTPGQKAIKGAIIGVSVLTGGVLTGYALANNTNNMANGAARLGRKWSSRKKNIN